MENLFVTIQENITTAQNKIIGDIKNSCVLLIIHKSFNIAIILTKIHLV